jgi:hypothetical protein
MSTREEQRDRQVDGGAGDNATDAGTGPPGDEESPLRTVAKVAAAGALAGAVAAAARAAATRGDDEDGTEGASQPSAGVDNATAESKKGVEAPVGDGEAEPRTDIRADEREAEEREEPEDEEPLGGRSEDSSVTGADGPLARIIGRAAGQLSDLAGHPAEGVLAFQRREDGWLVEVELVELARIPSTTDVLGVYEVEVDEDGQIQEYRRTRRYVRSQADDSAES